MAERPRAAPPRRRREARRLRALSPAPRGGLVARPRGRLPAPAARAVARVRPAAAEDRCLPLLLRPDLRSPSGSSSRSCGSSARSRCCTSWAPTSAGGRPAELLYAGTGRRLHRRLLRRDPLGPGRIVVPPGVDLREFRAVPASDRTRPIVVHAPSNRARKGTENVIAACRELDVELEIVEGLHHDEARKRYERADIVVDQLNAGWYGLFAIEAMALGKPVVTALHEDAVERTQEALRRRGPAREHDRGDARRDAAAARRVVRGARRGSARRAARYVEQRARRRPERRAADRDLRRDHDRQAGRPRVRGRRPASREDADLRPDHQARRSSRRSTASAASCPASSPSSSCRSTRATCPPTTTARSRRWSRPRPCSTILLKLGFTSAFFRFYFDAEDDDGRRKRRPNELLVHDGERDRGPGRRARCSPGRSRACSSSGSSQGSSTRRRSGCGRDELRADVRRCSAPRSARSATSSQAWRTW